MFGTLKCMIMLPQYDNIIVTPKDQKSFPPETKGAKTLENRSLPVASRGKAPGGGLEVRTIETGKYD